MEERKVQSNVDQVDRLAKDAARGSAKTEDFGYRSGDIARTKLGGSATSFPANGQGEINRVYRKDMVDRGKRIRYKIRFEAFPAERRGFRATHFAYIPPDMEDRLHRNHSYLVRLNNNPNYPNIETVIDEIQT